MASPEAEATCETVEVVEAGEPKHATPNGSDSRKARGRRRPRRSSYCLPNLACLRSEPDGTGSFDIEVVKVDGERPHPSHLVVMVNGLIGSAQNWRFAARQFMKKYPRDIIVHCSDCNPSMSTFDGVDVMGGRVAEEVKSIVKDHPYLQKISFIGHSLGGLVSRYAIARLYTRDRSNSDESGSHCREDKFEHKIAGLEPVNFITSATPHLGSRGHKQVPVFCGFQTLEKLAAHTSWVLGRTGKHLFLTDCDGGKPPLLLQMVQDTDNLKFISALQSFKCRVAYANANLVGWSTSSLRRRHELPKRDHLSGHQNYPHIINVEAAKNASPELEVSSENKAGGGDITDMEEEMLRHLTRLSWERIDVSFSGSKQRFLAHNTIQARTYLKTQKAT
ncbi:hypothetical protein CDL15_Pgr006623 [Punica granatum]|uniref:DUF676 domain-containing protein n=1 Tax=Punica granatum TaxID=22663 RepID=A0A218X6N1_PUNGR|nr:hypothetical protein CDL15_Pgr006623 [Punica granatum]